MHSFIQNLCVPSEPQLKPMNDCDIIDQFTLESGFMLVEDEEEGMGSWMLDSKPSQDTQEETMEVEEEPFTAKRRYNEIVDTSSKRPMFSKLQRMERAYPTAHLDPSSADIADQHREQLADQLPMMSSIISEKNKLYQLD